MRRYHHHHTRTRTKTGTRTTHLGCVSEGCEQTHAAVGANLAFTVRALHLCLLAFTAFQRVAQCCLEQRQSFRRQFVLLNLEVDGDGVLLMNSKKTMTIPQQCDAHS